MTATGTFDGNAYAATVKSFGYVIVETKDIDAWASYATELLGMMVGERSSQQMALRMDEYAYRLMVLEGDAEGIRALGWDCGDATNLAEIALRLEHAGFVVARCPAEDAQLRHVEQLVRLRDPDDNFDIELFWGLHSAADRFLSPTGVTFVTGALGLGHVFQAVGEVDAYRRLYVDLLGFRLSDHIDFAGGTFGLFMHCNARHHSFAVGVLPGRPLGIGHLMVQVTDIDSVGWAYDRVLDGSAKLYATLGKHTNDKMISFYCGSPSSFRVEYGFGAIEINEAWTPTRYAKGHYWGHRSPSNETGMEAARISGPRGTAPDEVIG